MAIQDFINDAIQRILFLELGMFLEEDLDKQRVILEKQMKIKESLDELIESLREFKALYG